MRKLMIGNLEPEENILPKTFTQTSDELYERHDYRLVYQNGLKKVFDNYQDLFQVWYSSPKETLSHVEVLDKKTKKEKNKKGFN